MSTLRLTVPRVAVVVASVVLACGLGVVATLVIESPGAHFAVAMACLLVTLGAAHVLARRRFKDSLNLLSLSALFYLIAFFVGALYLWFDTSLRLGLGAAFVERPAITDAVAMGVVAWICFAGGYFADPFRAIRRAAPPPKHLAGHVSTTHLVVVLLVIGWVARALLVSSGRYYHVHTQAVSPSSSSWFISAAALLPLIALAIVGTKAFGLSGRAPDRSWKLVFAGLLLTELAWAVPSGAREEVVDVLFVAVIVRYYTRGRLPSWKVTISLLLVLVFIVFPLINSYRLSNFRSSPTGALAAATNQTEGNSLSQTLKAGGDTLVRFADVLSVARILQVGRAPLNFSTASTAEYALEDFIPRAILPGKSNFGAFGNEFGRAYSFTSPSDFSTSVAVTEPGELYLGGGWPAVVFGMLILGGLLRMLDEYLSARRWDPAMLGLYAVIAPLVVVGLETSIALGFIGAIKAAILLGLLVSGLAWLLPRGDRAVSAVSAPAPAGTPGTAGTAGTTGGVT